MNSGNSETVRAGLAQVAPHADDAVECYVDERARVETMCGKRMAGLALRAGAGPVTIGIGKLLRVLLDGAGEWV